jgi:hypothetical protein
MMDMDSAVGRLDNLLMSLYVVIAALIIAVALEAQLVTLITGAGTLLLGMRKYKLTLHWSSETTHRLCVS